jgi:hypothetical protein
MINQYAAITHPSVRVANPNKAALIWGQSNPKGLSPRSYLFTGAGASISPSMTRQFQRVKIWNPTSGQYEKLQVGAVSSTNTGGGNNMGVVGSQHDPSQEDGFGPEIGLAQRWEQENPTGILYLIKWAVEGTSVTRWLPSANDLWPGLNTLVTNAKAALPAGVPIIGALTDQGESDQSDSAYATNYPTFMAAFSGLMPAGALKVVVRKTFTFSPNPHDVYVSGHADAREYDCADFTRIDNFHYDGRAQVLNGGQFAYNALFGTTGTINGY